MSFDSVDELKKTITAIVKQEEVKPVKLMNYLLPKKDEPFTAWSRFVDSLGA